MEFKMSSVCDWLCFSDPEAAAFSCDCCVWLLLVLVVLAAAAFVTEPGFLIDAPPLRVFSFVVLTRMGLLYFTSELWGGIIF